MSTVPTKPLLLLESDVLRLLGEGLDVEKIDEFLDLLFDLAARRTSVTCALLDDQFLHIQAGNSVLDVPIPRAKTKLRIVCARLSVRCSEWAQRVVSLYGDEVDFEQPSFKEHCKVRFQNTTVEQDFSIEIQREADA